MSLYESIADEDPYDDANLPLVNPDRGGTTGHPYGATSSVETIQEKIRRLERQLARQKRRAARANEAAEQLRLDVINLRHRAVYAEHQAKWWKDDTTRAFYSDARALRGGQVVNTGHRYLSTGCYHGDHGYCQNPKGTAGAKTPAQCKHCDARCICACHGTKQR